MKTGIVGSGLVGSTSAYALLMRGVGREIVLLDKNKARAQAEADDILHAVPFANPLRIRSGDYPDLAGCRAVILAAGVSQEPGETRLQLLERNAEVFREIVPKVIQHAPESVLVVATNPVDIMTHLAAAFAAQTGFDSTRVVGSGTTLDTARFRSLLGNQLGVDAQHVHAYVVGEHGDSEVLTWSLVTVGGMSLEEFCRQNEIELREDARAEIEYRVRNAAYQIIAGKGATYYGIGSALARIVSAILQDQRAILTVCTPAPQVADVADVTVSLPRLVGGNGVLSTFPLPVDERETSALRASATVVAEAIASLSID